MVGQDGEQHPSAEPPAASTTAEPLAIGSREQAMLLPLLRDVARALAGTPSGASYQDLLADVEAGAVRREHVETLEKFLEMGIQTGRFRARFGGLGEEALVRLFHQTPRGAAIATAVEEVNRALAVLAGQAVEQIRLSAQGPGGYALTIETDRCRLTLRLDPGGARVHDLELAL